MKGLLYIVATPIGNFSDFTENAKKILADADYLLCEDTRCTLKLLNHFEIKNKLICYHKFNEKQQLSKVTEDLLNGKKIALVSDAGTPCISDPGRILVNEAYEKGIKVVPIPGACAVTAFLSAVKKEDESYCFVGFLPRNKTEQKELLLKYKNSDLIFYDSPQRLLKTLANISDILGDNTQIAIGRELTKIHEEIKIGKIKDIINYFENNTLKGEIVGMIYKQKITEIPDTMILEKIKLLQEKNFSAKNISIILSTLYEINKNKVYELAIKNNP